MQVVILAAGMGKRLKNKTQKHSKSMLSFMGKTLLELSLDKLTAFPISRIVIVIGFCGDEIKRVIGNSYNNIPVIYIENPIYATTNNIYSFLLAKDYLCQEDTLLLESDLVYEIDIIKRLIESPFPNLAVVDKYKSNMDGTVVKINENNEITELITKEQFKHNEIALYYKTVNIYRFSKHFLTDIYLPCLENYCKENGYNCYYEEALQEILVLEKYYLQALRIEDEKWHEIDNSQDYEIAKALFCNNT